MDRLLITAAVRIIGLWWIFYEGGMNFYYVLIKRFGLYTTSTVAVTVNDQSLFFDVVFGVLLIVLAPFVTMAIFGLGKPATKAPPEA